MLTTDAMYIPGGVGPAESARQTNELSDTLTTLARTITYGYDDLYHLTEANYTGGELYQYAYDPVGNRLQQIINTPQGTGGDTIPYLYDAANRLTSVDGVGYTFNDNGNLLHTGAMTNTWSAANRLIASQRNGAILQPIYNGIGNRVGQTVNGNTTHFALDVQGLPEVIYTSAGNAYLHLSGVIVAENAISETRYLLSDGLGSVRQAVDENGAVIAYNEYDPYGNPVQNDSTPYGFTGEWWQDEIGLLYLRARWYAPKTGTFLSVDPVESEPPYLYVRGNPVNLTDPSGQFPELCRKAPNKMAYALCVLAVYRVAPTTILPDISYVEGTSQCYGGPVPYVASSYLEGWSSYLTFFQNGSEVTYDFAAMQRQKFSYKGGG